MDRGGWIFLGAGAATFLLRFSFIALQGRLGTPRWFVALLPLVPVAALAALVTPDLFLLQGHFHLGARTAAGLVAVGLAAWRRNTLLTIGGGFLALLVFSAWPGGLP